MTIEKKRCTGECKKVKPLAEFHRHKKAKDGRRSRCAICTNDIQRGPIVAMPMHVVRNRVKPDCMKAWWV